MPATACTKCGKSIKKSLAPRVGNLCAPCTRESLGGGSWAEGGRPGQEPIDVIVLLRREPEQFVDVIESDRKAGVRFCA